MYAIRALSSIYNAPQQRDGVAWQCIASALSIITKTATYLRILKPTEPAPIPVSELFRIIDSNVDSLEDAQVLGFAELHGLRRAERMISEYISTHYRPGDIILIEGVEGKLTDGLLRATLKTYPTFTSEMEIEGWDHKKSLTDSEGAAFIPKLETLRKIVEELKQTGSLEPASIESLSRLLSEELQNGSDLLEACKKAHRKIAEDYFNSVEELGLVRNRHLGACIAKHRAAGKRVFFIAGRAHLEVVESKDLTKKVVEVLKFTLEKHRFALVYPKAKSDEQEEKKASENYAKSHSDEFQNLHDLMKVIGTALDSIPT